MASENQARWENALEKLWARNRVHITPDMSAAYRDLQGIYENTKIKKNIRKLRKIYENIGKITKNYINFKITKNYVK